MSCWLHLVHSIGSCELCFFLYLKTCDPQATSYASCLDLYGDCDYAWIMKSVPVSLAACNSFPNTSFVVAVLLVCFSSFFMLVLSFVSFRVSSVLLGRVF